MLFHLGYLLALCAIILVTFYTVLLPLPTGLPTADLQSIQPVYHIPIDPPSSQVILLVCIGALIYLKIIWRLINPPHH